MPKFECDLLKLKDSEQWRLRISDKDRACAVAAIAPQLLHYVHLLTVAKMENKDIKASNIVLDKKGNVVPIDWGICSFEDDGVNDQHKSCCDGPKQSCCRPEESFVAMCLSRLQE